MSDTFRRNYKEVSESAKERIEKIKVAAEVLEALYDGGDGDPRQMAVAKTNLEQSVMWAVKSLTA